MQALGPRRLPQLVRQLPRLHLSLHLRLLLRLRLPHQVRLPKLPATQLHPLRLLDPGSSTVRTLTISSARSVVRAWFAPRSLRSMLPSVTHLKWIWAHNLHCCLCGTGDNAHVCKPTASVVHPGAFACGYCHVDFVSKARPATPLAIDKPSTVRDHAYCLRSLSASTFRTPMGVRESVSPRQLCCDVCLVAATPCSQVLHHSVALHFPRLSAPRTSRQALLA